MEARMRVTAGKASVREIVLGAETLIGRSPECNLKIASTQVSRKHCRISVTDRDVRVTDFGSANGTQLDGQNLTANEATVVLPGHELVIGPLTFRIEYTPPALDVVIGQAATMPETVDYTPDRKRQAALRKAVAAGMLPSTTNEPAPPAPSRFEDEADMLELELSAGESPVSEEACTVMRSPLDRKVEEGEVSGDLRPEPTSEAPRLTDETDSTLPTLPAWKVKGPTGRPVRPEGQVRLVEGSSMKTPIELTRLEDVPPSESPAVSEDDEAFSRFLKGL